MAEARLRTVSGQCRDSLTLTVVKDSHVPSSNCEQRRIAEILDTADEAIRSTERLIAKLEQAKQGLRHDLLARGIERSGTPLSSSDDQFTSSPIGVIPRMGG